MHLSEALNKINTGDKFWAELKQLLTN